MWGKSQLLNEDRNRPAESGGIKSGCKYFCLFVCWWVLSDSALLNSKK